VTLPTIQNLQFITSDCSVLITDYYDPVLLLLLCCIIMHMRVVINNKSSALTVCPPHAPLQYYRLATRSIITVN